MFDFVGRPNAKRSSAACGAMTIGTIDASRTNGFGKLVLLIITAQETVLDQGSHPLAVRTGSDLELGQAFIDFALGSTDAATHARHSQLGAQGFDRHPQSPENQSRESVGCAQQRRPTNRKTKSGVTAGYDD